MAFAWEQIHKKCSWTSVTSVQMLIKWSHLPGANEWMWSLLGDLMLTSWWHHQMETFSALLAICAGNSPVPSEFPAQRPVTQSFDVFFDLRLNKWFRKQSWGWWFETLSHPLWRHCNDVLISFRLSPNHLGCQVLSRNLVGHLNDYEWSLRLNQPLMAKETCRITCDCVLGWQDDDGIRIFLGM